MKKLIATVVVAAAIGLGWYFWPRNSTAAAAAGAAQPTQAKVERGPIVSSVASTGRVVSNLDVDIKAKASGEVKELPYDVSDAVKKGTLLVKLDPVDEDRNVKQAEVALAGSAAKLAQARQNVLIAERNLATARQRAEAALALAQARAKDAAAKADRMRQLLDKKLTSQEEAETADTAKAQALSDLQNAQTLMEELNAQNLALEVKRQDVNLADADVKSDEITLANARQRRTDTEVMSPIDGVVVTRTIQIGQIISSAITNVGGGTALLTLSDLSHVFVLASVDESDIGKIALRQPVRITVGAYPGVNFKGEIVRIATRGVNVSNVVTFEVKIEVTSENKTMLKPEMTTNVEIIAARSDNALFVPAEAVSRRGPVRVVSVIKADQTTEERTVEVGISDGIRTEISKGLTEGETVSVPKAAADSRWTAGANRQGTPRPPTMMGGGPRR